MAGNMDYYSAASQVLPLIFIGLAFETRYLTSRRTYIEDPEGRYADLNVNSLWSLGAIWVGTLLVAGEWAALDALHDGRATHFEEGLVGAALTFGGIALVAPLAGAQWSHIRPRLRHEWAIWLLMLLLFALGTLLLMDLYA